MAWLWLAALAAVSACVRSQSALVVAGEFRAAGGVGGLQNIALWNTNAWSRLAGQPLGEGIVWSVAVYAGELVAAGRYNLAGAAFVSNIARFDGFRWSEMGTGLEMILTPQYDVDVQALLPFKNTLIVAGYFDTAGGARASNIAQWDGVAWAPLGEGVNNEVFALAEFNNNLIVGGEFFTAGGAQAFYIAQWDGLAWSTLGGGITSGQGSKVFALTVYNGALLVGGTFEEAGGVPAAHIARWDGAAWSAVGAGVNSPVGPLAPSVNSFAVFRGDLILGGRFQSAGGQQANRIARWDGTAYTPLGSGLNDEVNVVTVYDDRVIVGGRFNSAGGIPIAQIAQWDGSAWSTMGFADEFDSYTWFHAFTIVTVASTWVTGWGGAVEGGFSGFRTEGGGWGGGGWVYEGGWGGDRTCSAQARPAGPVLHVMPVLHNACGFFFLFADLANCTLPGVTWRSQYYTPANVLVEDVLEFAANTSFTQSLTAFPFQTCGNPNTLAWSGSYGQTSEVDLILAYAACSSSGAGCLACGAASQVAVQYKFSSDCEVLTVLSPDSDEVRTYYANAKSEAS